MKKLMTPEQRKHNEEIIKREVKSLNKEGYGLRLFANAMGLKYQSFRNYLSSGFRSSDESLLNLAEFINKNFNRAIELETTKQEVK